MTATPSPKQPLAQPCLDAAPPQVVSFLPALLFWLKLGLMSFGGPAGQIALMHQELVVRRRWISERRFLHALHYCMVLPGPEAQQLATYLGWLMHKTWGGIVAGTLFVLPSLVLLIGLSWLYVAYGQLPLVAACLYGIKPAVIALVVQAAHRMGSRVLSSAGLWLIAALSFTATFVFSVAFPWVVLAAALLGWAGARWYPQWFKATSGGHQAQASLGPALIDDHTPTPTHARFSWKTLAWVVLLGLLLWLVPILCLLQWFGASHIYTQMAWFFTKAAWLTFGGAYAVLPYVYQGAVDSYAWLTPMQMMDGLALGETTPGPLIMVVAYVGFVGAYGQAVLGPDQLFLAGALAAILVTWFTFLPSFILILAGAPWVESSRSQLQFAAALTGITAAVVGVILHLALFFAYPVLLPQGFAGGLDGTALAFTALAGLALIRFQRSVMVVIVAAALAGYLVKVLGLSIAA